MQLTRRAVGPLALSAVLAACTKPGTVAPPSTTAPTIAVSTFSKYVQEVENGLSALILSPTVQALLGSATLSKVEATLADVRGVLRLVLAAPATVPVATAQSWVQQVEAGASEIADILSAVPGVPAAVVVVIQALEIVVPLMVSATGILLMKGSPTTFTPAQAEQILQHPIV